MEKASQPSTWKNAGIRSPRTRRQHRTRDRCGRTDHCRKISIWLIDPNSLCRWQAEHMMRKSEMQIGQFGQSRRMGNWPWQLFAALDLFSPFYDDDFRQTQPGLAPR